ncbi:MAG: hypothetical protein WCR69_08725 [Sulfuricurvum sp.]
MKKWLKYLPPLVMSGVAVFIIYFLFSLYEKQESVVIHTHTSSHEVESLKNSEDSWLKSLAKTKLAKSTYAVNEAELKFEIKEIASKGTLYTLRVSLLDPYEQFCLEEELKRYGFEHIFSKNDKNINVLIYSDSKERLDSLVKDLKNYKISSKIEPYSKDN